MKKATELVRSHLLEFYYAIRFNRYKWIQWTLAIVCAIVMVAMVCLIAGVFRKVGREHGLPVPTANPKPTTVKPTPIVVPNYFIFVKRSMQSICKIRSGKNCRASNNIPHHLTINGLLPMSLDPNVVLANCTSERFDLKTLKKYHMVVKLMQEWQEPGTRPNPWHYWRDQWVVHGTCSGMNQLDYFNASLQINAKYDINRWLDSAQIKPSNAATYNASQIISVFWRNSISPGQFGLICGEDKANKTSGQLLLAIRLCLSTNMQPIECVESSQSNCTGQFHYPMNYD